VSAVAATRVRAVSGIGGKQPACFLVETGAARFLLDLGEGPIPGLFPDLSAVGIVDAVLISHGHADHIGGLHLIDQIGNPPIYATAMTRAFAGHPNLSDARDLPLNSRIEISGVSIETGRAGHAAGAIWMRIGGESGVLYSGDLCRESLLYPVDPPLPAATLIADASYGSYDEALAPALAELLTRARRGPLLLPLPPTGRGVEIAVLLHEAGLPVAICAQHRLVAGLMQAAAPETLTPDAPQRLVAMLAAAADLDADSPPQGAMVAANGAATGGVARALFERFLADPAVTTLFTGHVEAGTPGKAAIEAGRADLLRWNVHPRLRDLIWLDETVRPATTLLAFCAPEDMAELARVLPNR
jgi:Cft2 family RNA processing exonuclease